MERLEHDWRFKEGDEVIGADDHKLGKVIAFYPDMTRPTHLVVEKGLLIHTDLFVPVTAVNNYDGKHIYVGVTMDQARAQGWDQQPAGPLPAEDAVLWAQ